MALAEWGLKYTCASCHCRFYDLQKEPVVCPKCSSPFDPDALFKNRRGRAAQAVVEKAPVLSEEDLDVAALDLEDLDPETADELAVADDSLLEVGTEEDALEEVIEDTKAL